MNKRIQLAKQTLRLLPSKSNPRVKRWQAPDEPEGKASLKGERLVSSNWLDPKNYAEMTEVMRKQHPHLKEHLAAIESIVANSPTMGFHSDDYKGMFPWGGGDAFGYSSFGIPIYQNAKRLAEIGIGGGDDYVAKVTGVALPLLKQMGLLKRENNTIRLLHQDDPPNFHLSLNIGDKLELYRAYDTTLGIYKMANHRGFRISPAYARYGLGTPLYAAQEALAKSTGHAGIELQAASAGPYAWPMLGFDFYNPELVINDLQKPAGRTLDEFVNRLGEFPNADERVVREEIERVRDLFHPTVRVGDPKYPRAWDLAGATIDGLGTDEPYKIGRDIMMAATDYTPIDMEKMFKDPQAQERYNRTVDSRLKRVLQRKRARLK